MFCDRDRATRGSMHIVLLGYFWFEWVRLAFDMHNVAVYLSSRLGLVFVVYFNWIWLKSRLLRIFSQIPTTVGRIDTPSSNSWYSFLAFREFAAAHPILCFLGFLSLP